MASVTITILQELGESRYLLKCSRCDATGKYIHNSSYECDTCSGRGTVLVEIINGSLPFVRCARCDGSGRYIHNSSYECESCKGIGAQPAAGSVRILK